MDDLHRLNPICQTLFPQNINAAKPGVIPKQKRSSFEPVFLLERNLCMIKRKKEKERKRKKERERKKYIICINLAANKIIKTVKGV